MKGHTKQESYDEFLKFVGNESQRERRAVNRRMFNVLLWCLILPVVVTALALFAIKQEWLPLRAKVYVGWMGLVFPTLYSVWVLGIEVLVELPALFQKGGIVTTLRSARKESQWRVGVTDTMRKQFAPWDDHDWRWVLQNFQIDLENMRYRTKHLTALAAAFFFIALQGIDSLGEEPAGVRTTWTKSNMLGWIESNSTDVVQYLGFAIILVLFYLSGNQTYRYLKRYMACALLVSAEKGIELPGSAQDY